MMHKIILHVILTGNLLENRAYNVYSFTVNIFNSYIATWQ